MWEYLAKLLGVRSDQVEDALRDEARCRRQLSRRGLLLGSAAITAGALLPAWGAHSASSTARLLYENPWMTPAIQAAVTGWGSVVLAAYYHAR